MGVFPRLPSYAKSLCGVGLSADLMDGSRVTTDTMAETAGKPQQPPGVTVALLGGWMSLIFRKWRGVHRAIIRSLVCSKTS